MCKCRPFCSGLNLLYNPGYPSRDGLFMDNKEIKQMRFYVRDREVSRRLGTAHKNFMSLDAYGSSACGVFLVNSLNPG